MHTHMHTRAAVHRRGFLHIPTDVWDKADVSPCICMFVPCSVREWSLSEDLLPRGGHESSRWREAWSTERCWRHKHTHTEWNAWSQTGMSVHVVHSLMLLLYKHMCTHNKTPAHAHRRAQTSRPQRGWDREWDVIYSSLFLVVRRQQAPRAVNTQRHRPHWVPTLGITVYKYTHTYVGCLHKHMHRFGMSEPWQSRDKTTPSLGLKKDKKQTTMQDRVPTI